MGIKLLRNRLDLQLWVKNLGDKAYYINLLGLRAILGNPRTFGGTARLAF